MKLRGHRIELGEIEALLAEHAGVGQAVAAVRVGLDDNFFDLGGNSLLLLGVRTKLLDRLPAPVSLVDMFRYPTIGTLAAALERTGPAVADAASKAAELAGRRRAGLARHARVRQGGRAHD